MNSPSDFANEAPLKSLSASLDSPWAQAVRRAGLPVLYHEESSASKDLVFDHPRTAIHSGKLGDILYSLPACRSLGVNHLVLNVVNVSHDPLRKFPFSAARQLVPLLLAQPYIKAVTISEWSRTPEELSEVEEIHYCFDRFRETPRHRAGGIYREIRPAYVPYFEDDCPAHLAEHFGATVGTKVDLAAPWLKVPPTEPSGKIAVSVTYNWRSYPERYWELLLEGLPNAHFVGLEQEHKVGPASHLPFSPAANHLELAQQIAASRLFLGTISFPYSIAEALKTPRLVELCRWNLNAFPAGPRGDVLDADVLHARAKIASLLELESNHAYRLITRRNETNPKVFAFRISNQIKAKTQVANQTRSQTLYEVLKRMRHSLVPRIFFFAHRSRTM